MSVKNFLFAMLLFFALCSLYFLQSSKEVLFESERGNYVFFVGSNSSNAKFYSCKANIANGAKIKGVATGESLFLDFLEVGEWYAVEKAEEIKSERDALFVFSENGEWGISEYYYCESIPYYTILKGKKINLQVSYSSTSVCIGSPMIFSSY